MPDRRHRAHAAPDREPHAVPPAARARPAPDRATSRSAPCSTSSGTTAREFRFDRRYRRAARRDPRATSSTAGRSRVPVPSGRLQHAARPRRPRRSCCAACARRSRPRWPAKVDELRSLRRGGTDIDLARLPRRVGPRPRRRLRRQRELVRPARGRRARRCLPPGPHEDDAAARQSVGCSTSTTTSASTTYRRLLTSERPRRSTRCRSASAGCCTCSSPASPTRRSAKTTTLQDAVDLLWAHPQVRAELHRAARCARRSRRPRPRAARDPSGRRRCRSTRATPASRSSPRSGSARRRQDRRHGRAACTRPRSANAELLAFTLDKSSGRLLADHPLPRLRHQPRR